jgi:hypothetical protein
MTAKKPITFSGDLAHLPPALAPLIATDHWVVWRWEWRKDRWTKPPYMAAPGKRRAHAKNNDPATWTSYPAALAAVLAAGNRFDGIGFALLATSFAVVDLDNCVDPATGKADASAKAWVEAANGAYIERTPSGAGLRIVCGGGPDTAKLHRRWSIKGAPREKAQIEIYRNCERYITVTGAQIGDCRKLGAADGLLEKIRTQLDEGGDEKGDGEDRGEENGFDFNQARAQTHIDYDTVIRNGAPPNTDASALFHSVVGHLNGKGLTLDEIVEELGRWPRGIGQRYAGRLRQEVKRSLEKWRAKQRIAPDHIAPQPGEPEEPMEWDDMTKKGVPRSTTTNTRRALRALGIRCRYDRFHDKLLVDDEPNANLDHIALMLRMKIHKAFRFDPSTGSTIEALIQLCKENEFDPVADYLNGLAWDGTPRLDRWLVKYLGAEDNELNRAFGRIALVAGVRRVRRPGVKFDPIIVFEGPMGTEKSKAIETLAGIENFSDQTILGARDREQQELLAGVWLFEIAELSNIRKTEVEHIKAFTSRTHDRARPAYGRTRVDQPRRCILFATTNEDRYLKMADRRFWPVRTTTIDIEALKRDRDQLWAEAAQRESEGASIVLDRRLWGTARIEQEVREEEDPWDATLAETVGTIERGEERVSTSDLLGTVLGIHISKQRDLDYKRLSRCMRRLGWDGSKPIRIAGKTTKGYSRPHPRTGHNDDQP